MKHAVWICLLAFLLIALVSCTLGDAGPSGAADYLGKTGHGSFSGIETEQAVPAQETAHNLHGTFKKRLVEVCVQDRKNVLGPASGQVPTQSIDIGR